MSCTAVYLMHNAWSEANYKVGVSKAPPRRSGQVCIEYEVDPDIIQTVWFTCEKSARLAEKYWHRYLQDFRTDDHSGKEWFALSQEYVQKFCRWSDNSMSKNHIIKWLYNLGASKQALADYDYGLLKTVPRHTMPPTIDLWMNNAFKGNSP